MGKVIKKGTLLHYHDYPRAFDAEGTLGIGTIWQCECGETFRLFGDKNSVPYWAKDNLFNKFVSFMGDSGGL